MLRKFQVRSYLENVTGALGELPLDVEVFPLLEGEVSRVSDWQYLWIWGLCVLSGYDRELHYERQLVPMPDHLIRGGKNRCRRGESADVGHDRRQLIVIEPIALSVPVSGASKNTIPPKKKKLAHEVQ